MGPSLMFLLLPAAVGSRIGGVAPKGRSNQVRGVVHQRRFRGQGIRGPLFGGSGPRVSSDATASGSCLVDADNISGIQFPCCQSSFPFAAGCASKKQEWPPGAEQISNAAARELEEGSRSLGGYEPGFSSYVASSGSCLVDTHCGDTCGVRLPCGQGSFPLPACCAELSKSQEGRWEQNRS